MKAYRYILEPYKGVCSRHVCPKCEHKHEYSRYMDINTGEFLPIHVGKCNRINECGYHFSPKQYFQDTRLMTTNMKLAIPAITQAPINFIPVDYFVKSYENVQNNFMDYLHKVFDKLTVSTLHFAYAIGTGQNWPGATVFWQLDYYERIRTGKIILYDNLGKRIKKPYNHISWVHRALINKGIMKEFNLKQCFFGEHLLRLSPKKKVGIVEGESTAIVAAGFMPDFTWLATGGCNGCKWYDPEVFKVLKDREIILYPDLGYYEKWHTKAVLLQKYGYNVKVSDLLERKATPEQKAKGNLDLRDYLVKSEYVL